MTNFVQNADTINAFNRKTTGYNQPVMEGTLIVTRDMLERSTNGDGTFTINFALFRNAKNPAVHYGRLTSHHEDKAAYLAWKEKNSTSNAKPVEPQHLDAAAPF